MTPAVLLGAVPYWLGLALIFEVLVLLTAYALVRLWDAHRDREARERIRVLTDLDRRAR